MIHTKKLFLILNILSLGALANFQPYAGEPPQMTLTPDQQTQVAQGKLVFLLDNTKGETKEGSVAFRVNARQDAIWKILSDFSKYSEWSYKVNDAKAESLGGDRMLVDFTASVVKQHYYVINNFPMKDWATWNTDHTKANDCVLDTVGFWRIKPVDGNPNQSDVIQYGKIKLTSLCANGFFGIGGFNAHDMANQIYTNLKARSEAL